jgi:hypothetical protein
MHGRIVCSAPSSEGSSRASCLVQMTHAFSSVLQAYVQQLCARCCSRLSHSAMSICYRAWHPCSIPAMRPVLPPSLLYLSSCPGSTHEATAGCDVFKFIHQPRHPRHCVHALGMHAVCSQAADAARCKQICPTRFGQNLLQLCCLALRVHLCCETKRLESQVNRGHKV